MILITPCPHCYYDVLIYEAEINCGIFRHGVYKDTGEIINPHTSKEICERLIEEERIYGCGKPFRIIRDNEGKFRAEICDYL